MHWIVILSLLIHSTISANLSQGLDKSVEGMVVSYGGNQLIRESRPSSRATPSLIVEVRNIKNNDGYIKVVLWSKREDFADERKAPYRYVFFRAQKGTMKFAFYDLENTKTVSLFASHGKQAHLRKNIFGVPMDPYQFGNNSRRRFSKPDAKDAEITLSSEVTTHVLNL